MRQDHCYSENLKSFTRRRYEAGQTKLASLLRRYGPDDYNRLHRDLFSPLVFPIQVTVLLSDSDRLDVGEFMLVENRPRMQAQVELVSLRQGEVVLIAVDYRPAREIRGTFRLSMRHGVSRIQSGAHYAIGIIFHDA